MIDPAETIKNFRKLHKLQQKDIAAHMYVSAATISTWERKQCRVSAEDFIEIMDFLGYEVVVRKKNPEWKDIIEGANNVHKRT